MDVHIPSQRQGLVVQKYRNQWMSHRSSTRRLFPSSRTLNSAFLFSSSSTCIPILLGLGITEQHVFRSTNETRFDGPCQGTGGSFGFQEAATEVAAPINCRSTLSRYASFPNSMRGTHPMVCDVRVLAATYHQERNIRERVGQDMWVTRRRYRRRCFVH